ncbi:ABC transporter ATP-binding protein/permease [bacterium]|nr:ABC transporter ATP-binding protein/permease [bacterium]
MARLLEIAGDRKGLLIVSGITVTFHAVLTMIPYVLIFYILKELLGGQVANPNIGTYLMWAGVAIAISFLLMFAAGMASHIAAFNILYELRVKIAEKLGKLPMGYVSTRSSGALKKILSDDVERIETFIAHGIPDMVKAVALPVIMLTYLFIADWRLALISFVPLIILVFAVSMMMGTERSKKTMKKYHDSLEDMNAGIVEFVRAMPVMKIFGQSAAAFTRYSGTVNEFDLYVKKWAKISAPVWGMLMSFLTNALLPVLAFGLYLYFKAGLSLSVFFLFLILGAGYIRPVFALVSLSTQIVMISHGVKRMDEILFEIKEQKNGTKANPENFTLEFNQVNFSYTEEIKVLKDVSFKVPPGSITALVGPSGSGKSTAGQLVARFYDVKSGSITLGGININDLDIGSLMQNVGFVFQDNMMFYQSIYDNILMGMDKTKDEVMAAAKKARCHEFIMKLPESYATHFGDKGVHLSGGEQQRIQLARVVLKNAPVLILDEATAFSDPENEHLIMEAFSELIQNKTVIIIAHRLSTIANVEQIVVLDKGEVAAIGTYSQLLKKSELYTRMWNAHTRAKEFEIINQEAVSSC